MNRRGRFITLDGPGGVGKSSTVAALAALLADEGEAVLPTAEPTDSDLGQFVRGHADRIGGRALACLIAADRYDHLEREILPQLAAGRTVVCDRYLASSLVVQRLDGVPEEYLLDLHAGVLLPDLAVVLTAAPETIAARIARRGARHRFERDPDIPRRETALYERAVVILRGWGVEVLVVDAEVSPPQVIADRIAAYRPGGAGQVPPRVVPGRGNS
ncbi:dTMP kinase [Streptomyces polygonati]|uniref:Thymidylate kinase n=1 Tax=Streptomyces polygonati TaxID=1617087 RepID=A0ABV8HLW0_9ACTN